MVTLQSWTSDPVTPPVTSIVWGGSRKKLSKLFNFYKQVRIFSSTKLICYNVTSHDGDFDCKNYTVQFKFFYLFWSSPSLLTSSVSVWAGGLHGNCHPARGHRGHSRGRPPADHITAVMVLNDIGETKGGGLKYEVVLEEAKTKKMPRPKSAPAIRKYEDIEEKLKVRQTSSVVKHVKSTPQTMSKALSTVLHRLFSLIHLVRSLIKILYTGRRGSEAGHGARTTGGDGRQGEEGGGGQGQEGHSQGGLQGGILNMTYNYLLFLSNYTLSPIWRLPSVRTLKTVRLHHQHPLQYITAQQTRPCNHQIL